MPCCPSNLSRTWADLGKYIYSVNEKNIWVHQYIGSTATLEPGSPVRVEIESDLPWDGQVKIKVNPPEPIEFILHLRLPSWSVKTQIQVNGAKVETTSILPKYDFTATAQGYDPRPSENTSWIATLGVMPDFRRQGIARAMLTTCEDRLPTPKIRLCVRTQNPAAIPVYELAGYNRLDIWQKYHNAGGMHWSWKKSGRADRQSLPRIILSTILCPR
jgi:GNAT superfamily N-acetyltransferase